MKILLTLKSHCTETGTKRNTNFCNVLLFFAFNYKHRSPGDGKKILTVSVFQKPFLNAFSYFTAEWQKSRVKFNGFPTHRDIFFVLNHGKKVSYKD